MCYIFIFLFLTHFKNKNYPHMSTSSTIAMWKQMSREIFVDQFLVQQLCITTMHTNRTHPESSPVFGDSCKKIGIISKLLNFARL